MQDFQIYTKKCFLDLNDARLEDSESVACVMGKITCLDILCILFL